MKRLKHLLLTLALLLLPALAQAQFHALSGTGDYLTVTLAGSAATTEPTFSVLWEGNGGPANAIGVTTGATAKSMLTGEAGSPPRVVKQIALHNSDTAAVTATFKRVTGGTTYQIGKFTLPSLSTLCWTENQVRVTDASGQQSQTTTDYGSIGAASQTTVAATETTTGYLRRTRLTLNALSVTLADATVQGGSTKIYDFPEGRVLVLGVTAAIAPTTTSTIASTVNSGVAGVWSLGTAIATADAALTSTEADLLPSTAWTSSTTINVAAATVVGALAASAQFDGTTTAKDMYLSCCVTGATDIDADGTVAWSGYIDVTYLVLGDY